jgi:glycosyltransferase involved in cell wall biosynthesis
MSNYVNFEDFNKNQPWPEGYTKIPFTNKFAKETAAYFNTGAMACAHYRAYQPMKYVTKEYPLNIDCINRFAFCLTWETETKSNQRFLFDIYEKYKAMVIQRSTEQGALDFMQCAQKYGKKVIYEIDDNYLKIPIYNPNYKLFQPVLKTFNEFVSQADMITVTTEPLRHELLKFNKNIKVIPNALDFEQFDAFIKQEYQKPDLVIGWTGTATHYQDLKECEAAVEYIVNKYSNVKLFYGGDNQITEMFKNVSKEKKIVKPWQPIAFYPEMLNIIDIGICPLEDHAFNYSKSNLKYIELAAEGTPVIASKVYPYEKTITHGVNGLITKNRFRDWVKYLELLINDWKLREKLGRAARQLVYDKYNQENFSELWYNVLKG